MKKLFPVIIVLCLFVLAGCDFLKDIEPHEHTFTDNGAVTKEPTCTQKGERTLICTTCHEAVTFDIDPLGHDWNEGEVTAHNACPQLSERILTCNRCGATTTQTFLEHDWDLTDTVASTCCTNGQQTFVCSGCGEEKTETLEHDPDNHPHSADWSMEPDKHYHVATCEHTGLSTAADIGTHVFDIVVETVPATCSSTGQIKKTCSVCGYYVFESTPTDPDAHSYGDPVVTTSATCTTEGTIRKTCTLCGHVEEEQYLDPDTHEFTAWESNDEQHWHEATCVHEVTCTPQDHVWGDEEILTQGDCHTDGVIGKTCTVCGHTVTETIPKEEFHEFNTSTHICAICGEISYFQASHEGTSNNVTLRASFASAELINLVIPQYVYSKNYANLYRAEFIRSVKNSTMQSLTIPDGVTTIGYQALKGNPALHTVNLPSTLTTIEQEAFMECTALESIHIPASVTSIGAQAFGYCSNLADVYFEGTRAQWNAISFGKNAFKGTSGSIIYHCSDD